MSRVAKKKISLASSMPSLANPIHRSRYFRHHIEKKELEEIAEEDGVSLEIVQRSLKAVELYYQMTTETELRSSQISLIMKLADLQEKSLSEALKAKRPVLDDKGEIVSMEPDHNVRMQANAIINDKIEAITVKGKSGSMTQVNVGVGITSGGERAHGGTFEDRLREIQRKRQDALPAPVAEEVVPAIEDAEEVDEGEYEDLPGEQEDVIPDAD